MYCTLEKIDKRLIIIPDMELINEEREYLEGILENEGIESLLYTLIEYDLCNSWSIVNPEDIGALTEAPILENDYQLFWFSDYMIIDEAKELLSGNSVSFDYAGEIDKTFFD